MYETVLTGIVATAQKGTARIENLRMEIVDNKIVIYYDLLFPDELAEEEVFLRFYTDKQPLIGRPQYQVMSAHPFFQG